MRAFIWKLADRLISLSAFIGILGLSVAVLDILIDVIGREFNRPLTGAQDISQMAMLTMVFGGMALADRLDSHISVDVFEGAFSPGFNRITQIVSPALGALVFFMLAKTMWDAASLSRLLNLATNIIYLPKAWFQYLAMVMSVITGIAMTMRAIDNAFGSPLLEHPVDKAL